MPETPLTNAINALTAYANTVTGASDTTLSDAVESLVDGYGGGGGGETLIHSWDFTSGLTDSVGGVTAVLHGATQSSSGISFAAASNYVSFSQQIFEANTRIELDITSYDRQGTGHGQLFMSTPDQGFAYRNTGYWGAYRNCGGSTLGWQMTEISDPTYFDGHTLKIAVNQFGQCTFFNDNTEMFTINGLLMTGNFMLGSSNGSSAYNLLITGLRIYSVPSA